MLKSYKPSLNFEEFWFINSNQDIAKTYRTIRGKSHSGYSLINVRYVKPVFIITLCHLWGILVSVLLCHILSLFSLLLYSSVHEKSCEHLQNISGDLYGTQSHVIHDEKEVSGNLKRNEQVITSKARITIDKHLKRILTSWIIANTTKSKQEQM